MPKAKTLKAAARDKREGKSPSTQAGEFVREEIENVRKGAHGVRSTEQAIAIGLSMARRAGVDLPPPPGARKSTAKRVSAKRATPKKAASKSLKRSRATLEALRREDSEGVTSKSLAAHAKKVAARRSAADRSASAKKAARTKGASGRAAAAKKAVRTRGRS